MNLVCEHVIESAFVSEEKLRVDPSRSVIYDVKILGPKSANGRDYIESTMRRAVESGVYEGASVNLNHPPSSDPTKPRLVEERLGALKGIQYRDGSLYAREFRFNPKHPQAEGILWAAEHEPSWLGFSPNHSIKTRLDSKTGRRVVESINQVLSVDLVADPATTKGIFEHRQPAGNTTGNTTSKGEPTVELTLESIQKEHADLFKQITAHVLEQHKASADIATKDAEIKKLTDKVLALEAKEKAAERKAAVDTKLADAKLPEVLVTEGFKTRCYGAADDKTLESLIGEQSEIAKHLKVANAATGAAKPKSKDQSVVESRGNGDAEMPDNVKDFARRLRSR